MKKGGGFFPFRKICVTTIFVQEYTYDILYCAENGTTAIDILLLKYDPHSCNKLNHHFIIRTVVNIKMRSLYLIFGKPRFVCVKLNSGTFIVPFLSYLCYFIASCQHYLVPDLFWTLSIFNNNFLIFLLTMYKQCQWHIACKFIMTYKCIFLLLTMVLILSL